MELRTLEAPESILAALIPKMSRDMRFVAWFTIIYGGLASLTIIGAIVGVPMLIGGLRLKESADAFDGYRRTNDLERMAHALDRQGRYFFIQKVFVIVSIFFIILYLIAIAAAISYGLFEAVKNTGGISV
ncbi:MAG TPA: DUF5362 domain-containing protein [Rhodothermales bacterium]|nr:DUF5362 domain-containing protein [Rhodothermales bacterium]